MLFVIVKEDISNRDLQQYWHIWTNDVENSRSTREGIVTNNPLEADGYSPRIIVPGHVCRDILWNHFHNFNPWN
jgi:hypothetical protein